MAEKLTTHESQQRRNPIITIAGNYLLTDVGQKYCTQRSIPVRDIRTYDGNQGTGFVWQQFDPDLTMKFVSHGLISSIHFAQFEFTARKYELSAITKYIIYGILHKRFRPELKERLKRTGTVRELIKNVRLEKGINLTGLSNEWYEKFVQNHRSFINTVRHSLYYEPASRIDSRSDLTQDDKEERKRDLMGLINAIDQETWFFFTFFKKSEERLQLLQTLYNLILSYIERMAISDYLSLILIELVQYAEKAHLQNLAERDTYLRNHPEELQERLRDPQFRERLVQRAEYQNELVHLAYSFDGNPHNPYQKTEVIISIRNGGLIGYKRRSDIINKRHKHTKQSSLGRFFQEQTVKEFSCGLAQLYLSSIEQACAQEDVEFDTSIARDEKNEETITRLKVAL